MISTIRIHCLDWSHPLLFVPPLLAAEQELFLAEAGATRGRVEGMVAVVYIPFALDMRTHLTNLHPLRLAATLHLPAPHPNNPLERSTVLRDPCQAQASPQDYLVLWTQVPQGRAFSKRATPLKTLIQTRIHRGSGRRLAS